MEPLYVDHTVVHELKPSITSNERKAYGTYRHHWWRSISVCSSNRWWNLIFHCRTVVSFDVAPEPYKHNMWSSPRVHSGAFVVQRQYSSTCSGFVCMYVTVTMQMTQIYRTISPGYDNPIQTPTKCIDHCHYFLLLNEDKTETRVSTELQAVVLQTKS